MTTQLQSKMIHAIARSVYNAVDGGEPESAADAVTWAEMVIETATFISMTTALNTIVPVKDNLPTTGPVA